jgi:O-antigen/teichoic acid export membrane protein
MPWREVLGFTFPLLTTDLTYAAMSTLSVVLLGHAWGTTGVASLTAVLPAARMNELVMNTFGILYVPLAARMFAVQDRLGINALYWRTSMWIAIFTFPVFAVTFALAEPLTVTLFGERYAASAPVLALLAAGYYFNAALGFNGLTLKVFGLVRAIVLINLATIASSVLLSVLLIPGMGAFGAAIAITGALVIHNLLKQVGLKLGTGVRLFETRYLRAYAGIAACAAGLYLVRALLSPPVPVVVALAALASWILLRANADLLELGDTFPEVMRMPGMKFLLPPARRGRSEARG